MNIKSVTYQKVYAIGAYITERIGVEASVDEGQDPKFVLAELKKLCDEVNTANNPHLTETQPSEPTTLPTLKVEREIQPIDKQIMEITDPVVLKTFETFCKNNPALKELYETRLKQITDGLL
jgi:hypothetical protein